tara:strand:+ start:849 stop:1061 length:213 start_codon:yes stop_codon:yes gene_type:complete
MSSPTKDSTVSSGNEDNSINTHTHNQTDKRSIYIPGTCIDCGRTNISDRLSIITIDGSRVDSCEYCWTYG